MAYKITITKIESESVKTRGAWNIVSQKYISADDYSDIDDLDERRKYKRLDNGQYVMDVYGYLPDEQLPKETTKEIYSQTVSDLIVEEVIRAVLSAASPKVGQMIPVSKQRDS